MKKSKIEFYVDIFGIVWTSIFLMVYLFFPTGLYYGQNAVDPINNIIVIPGILYLIIKKIVTKENVIINNKIDIFINLFFVTMTFPIVFNTYISLNECVTGLLSYFSILVFYNAVKNLCKRKSYISFLSNTFLIFVLIIMLYGIDFRTFGNINNFFNLKKMIEQSDNSIYSFFYYYHNELSIVMGIGILISQSMLMHKKSKFYSIALLNSLIGFILAMSRISVTILLFAEVILYFICKKKNQNCNLVIFVISLIIAFIYRMIFINYGNIAIICSYVIFNILVFCLSYINIEKHISKLYDVVKKYLFNKKIIVSIVILLILVLAFDYFTSFDITINSNNFNSVSKRFVKISNVKFGQDNIAEIDYNYDSDADMANIYQLKILVVNKNGRYDEIQKINLNKYTTNSKLYFHVPDTAIQLIMRFESTKTIVDKIHINYLKVNGKSQVLDSHIIPHGVRYFIESFDLNNVSVNERINLYKDSIKMIFDSKFIGRGYNAWKCEFQNVQSLNYYSTEIHSRPLEILLSYGIIGFIAYLLVIYEIINRCIKEKYNNIFIILGILLILLQSCVDFVLSQYSTIVLLYFLIGIISSSLKNINKKHIFDNIAITIYLLISIYVSYEYLCISTINGKEQYICDKIEYDSKSRIEKINRISNDFQKKLELKNELEKQLNYERFKKNYIYLNQYVETCIKNNYDLDDILLDKVINNLHVADSFALEVVYEYISNLVVLKEYLLMNEKYNKYIDIINNKIQSQVEDISIKYNNYKYYRLEIRRDNLVEEDKVKAKEIYNKILEIVEDEKRK